MKDMQRLDKLLLGVINLLLNGFKMLCFDIMFCLNKIDYKYNVYHWQFREVIIA